MGEALQSTQGATGNTRPRRVMMISPLFALSGPGGDCPFVGTLFLYLNLGKKRREKEGNDEEKGGQEKRREEEEEEEVK